MYIVIETFDPEYPVIVTNKEGMPLLFETEKEAETEACECQNGIIVNY